MKIIFKKGDKERKIPLPVPAKIVVKALLKEIGEIDPSKIRKSAKEIVRFLKEYKKENGAFTFVEIEESDGNIIKIIV